MGKQCQTLFFWAPKSLQMVTAEGSGWGLGGVKLAKAELLTNKDVTKTQICLIMVISL